MRFRSLFVFALIAAIIGLFASVLSAVQVQHGALAALGVYILVDSACRLPFLSARFGAMPTLLDIAKLNGNDASVGLIEENIRVVPEMQVFPMRSPIRGTSYMTGVRTGVPTVGFRAAGAGSTPVKSTFKKQLVECFIIDAQVIVDKAVADAFEDGAPAYQAIEASGVTQGALRGVGSQIFYGVAHDAKGFPGLKAFLPKAGTTLAGDALVVNAAGTTAATASSVYAVKFGMQDAILVPGNGMSLELGDWRTQTIADPADASKFLTAYVNGLTGWIGLQLGNENCARRICNLTADTGKGLTDALLAQLLATFPTGMMPDAIFMSRRSRTQLQLARTVVLQGQGKVRPDQSAVAPIPTEYDGVPIVATDSILNTDALE